MVKNYYNLNIFFTLTYKKNYSFIYNKIKQNLYAKENLKVILNYFFKVAKNK